MLQGLDVTVSLCQTFSPMQTPLQEGRSAAPARGSAVGSLGSHTNSANQLHGASGGGSTSSTHVKVSGIRRRNVFSLGKSEQEKVRGEKERKKRDETSYFERLKETSNGVQNFAMLTTIITLLKMEG